MSFITDQELLKQKPPEAHCVRLQLTLRLAHEARHSPQSRGLSPGTHSPSSAPSAAPGSPGLAPQAASETAVHSTRGEGGAQPRSGGASVGPAWAGELPAEPRPKGPSVSLPPEVPAALRVGDTWSAHRGGPGKDSAMSAFRPQAALLISRAALPLEQTRWRPLACSRGSNHRGQRVELTCPQRR